MAWAERVAQALSEHKEKCENDAERNREKRPREKRDASGVRRVAASPAAYLACP